MVDAIFSTDKINLAIYGSNLKEYNYVINDLKIQKEKIDEVLNVLKKYAELKYIKNLKTYIGKNTKIYIELTEKRKSYILTIYTSTLELYTQVQNELYKYVDTSKERTIVMRNWLIENNQLEGFDRDLKKSDIIDVNEKYYPYLNVDLMLKEFFEGNENILILASEKGTAKSKFISLIMKKFLEGNFEINKDIDRNILYLDTAKDISVIALDKFWTEVRDADLLVLDDLDFVLSSRDSNRNDVEKNKFLSNILSFTDGISKVNTKIIITTNQPIEELDEALLREGRLFAILKFRKLTYEEALEVWKSEGLDVSAFEQIFKGKDIISPAELGSKISNIKRNKKYLEMKDWLLDQSVNALHKSSKKTGFI